jgi:hypothetical protein
LAFSEFLEMTTGEESPAERKRKRLEAWRKRRQETETVAPPPAPLVKVSLSLHVVKKESKSKKKISPVPKPINPFGAVDDDDDESEDEGGARRGKLSLGLGFSLNDEDKNGDETQSRPSKRRKGRWDADPGGEESEAKKNDINRSGAIGDTLEKFMDKLQAGAMGSVATQVLEAGGTEMLSIDVGGSMMRVPKLKQSQSQPSPISGGIITSEQIAKFSAVKSVSKSKKADPDALYTASDWESDAAGGATSASEVSDIEAD